MQARLLKWVRVLAGECGDTSDRRIMLECLSYNVTRR
jgi:hypothetical protein